MMSLLAIALVGGLMLSGINIMARGDMPKDERPPADFYFFMPLVFWPFVGAFLTWVLIISGNEINGIGALITGLTAPSAIQRYMQIGSAGGPSNAEPNGDP